MYQWKIVLHMSSMQALTGYYEGPEKNSGDVANRVIAGASNEFFGLYGDKQKTRNLLVKKGEIVAADISEWR